MYLVTYSFEGSTAKFAKTIDEWSENENTIRTPVDIIRMIWENLSQAQQESLDTIKIESVYSG